MESLHTVDEVKAFFPRLKSLDWTAAQLELLKLKLFWR